VVRVLDYLQANGTAYMVMALAKGETLDVRLKSEGTLTPEAVQRLMRPLLKGLEAVHAQGFLHRDIKPANIILDDDGEPTLIDFGASRQAMADRSTALTAIFSPGYAAPEQMSSSRQQGPWTDIYGLAATFYQAITGRAPPNAMDRMQEDTLQPLARRSLPGFPQALLEGIDAGLAVRASQRPQSIAEWRKLLEPEPAPVVAGATATAAKVGARRRPRVGLWAGGVAAALLLAAGVGYYLYPREAKRPPAPVTATTPPTAPGSGLRPGLLDLLARVAPSYALPAREAQVGKYVTDREHKALAAFAPSGSWRTAGWNTPALAERHALESCEVRYGAPCVLLAVDDALQPQAITQTPRAMPRVAYDGVFDPEKIPTVGEVVRKRPDVVGYRDANGAKAAAFHPRGRLFVVTGAANQREAEQKALANCTDDPPRGDQDGQCFLYAAGNQVVLPRRATEPISAAPRPPPSEPPKPESLRDALLRRVAQVAPDASATHREQQVTGYLEAPPAKALAGYASGTWRTTGHSSPAVAEERALESCEIVHGEPCVLIAVNDTIEPSTTLQRRQPMPRASYGGLFDPEQIPVSDAVRRRADIASYRTARGPKAAAYHPWGRLFVVTGAPTQRDAEEKALADCNADPQRNNRDGTCYLYAVGNQVILPRRSHVALTAASDPK
jgi:hypothetical protein